MNSIDEQSRDKIKNDIGTNFFVEAGAGSGKTHELVERMVAMVESGIDISEISAITFTKAAANEFYERFQKELAKRDTENAREALKNIDQCFMGTIDAFCYTILHEHPFEAGIPSDAKVLSDEERNAFYITEYHKILNDSDSELDTQANLFKRLHQKNHEVVFVEEMDYLMGHRNAKFIAPKGYDSGLDDNLKQDIRKFQNRLTKLCDYLITLPELRIVSAFDSGPEALALVSDVKRDISKKDIVQVFNSIKFGVKKIEKIRLIEDFDFDSCKSLEIEPMKKRAPAKEDEDKGNGCEYHKFRIKKSFSEEWKAIENRIPYKLSMPFLLNAAEKIEKKWEASGSLAFFDCLYYLRNMLKKDAENDGKLIRHIQDKHKYYLIDEFQDTDPMQAEVFFYLTAENPDADWTKCDPKPGSLFIVGDPKQSIYRFRNADVAQFRRVKNLFNNGVGEVLQLTKNYRSTKKMCEFFNETFSERMSTETDDQSKYENIEIDEHNGELKDEFEAPAYYYASSQADDPSEVANIVKRMVERKVKIFDKDHENGRPVEYKDFMVITPDKKHLDNYITKFQEIGIPIRVNGKVQFSVCHSLIAMTNLYSCVTNPRDQVSLFATLEGPLFKLKDADIFALVDKQEKFKQLSLYSNCNIEEVPKKARAAFDRLKGYSEIAKHLSPSALLEKLTEEFEIFRKVPTDNMDVFYYILELLRNAEANKTVVSHSDAVKFLRDRLNGVYEEERCLKLDEDDNAVLVANLHKVKGLEAPIVILAFAHDKEKWKTPKYHVDYSESSPLGYVFKGPKIGFYELFKLPEEAYEEDEKYRKARTSEMNAQKAEGLREIYVAATRAKNLLIICKPQTKEDKTLKCRWDYKKNADDESLFFNNLEKIDDELSKLKKRGKNDINNFELFFAIGELYENAIDSCVFKDREAKEGKTYELIKPSEMDKSHGGGGKEKVPLSEYSTVIGTSAHSVMEALVSSKGNIEVNKLVDFVLSQNLDANSRKVEPDLRKMLKSLAETMKQGGYPQKNGVVQDILPVLQGADEVFCEMPFTYKEDGAVIDGVMDLVYQKEGEWHILDWKTNYDDEGLEEHYSKQLNAYKKAFKQATGIEVADAHTYHLAVK